MKSESMKPKDTNLVGIGYNKNKNRYFATFKVQDLDEKEIGIVMAYCEKHQKDRKIYIDDDNVYVTDFFEADFFESLYPFMIESARQGVVPERVDPSILNVEVDLCIMEHEVDFSVRRMPDLIKRHKEVLKGVSYD